MSYPKPSAVVPILRTPVDAEDGVDVRLLLICQSEGLRNRYQSLAGFEESDDNSGLTAVGWEQTNLLAGWLKTHEKIDVLLCGPQLRSRLTAQRIGQMLGLPIKVRTDLPKYAADAVKSPGGNQEMPRLPSALAAAPLSSADADYGQFCAAVIAVVDQVLTEHWGKTIALVLNGAAVAAVIRQFFGAQLLPISVLHAGITEFNRRGGQWRLAYVNRREHLPAPQIAPFSVGASAALPTPAGINPEELARIVEVYNRLGAMPREEAQDAERIQRMRDLTRFAHLAPDQRVLEVGTGGGQLALLLAEEGAREVVAVDVSPVMLETAEFRRLSKSSPTTARVSFRLAPAQALPFNDEWFDAVVCRLVVQHTSKPERMVAEAARVLKMGGVFIFADLLGADDAVKRATQNAIEERRNPAYVAARTADYYRKLINSAGLVIESEKATVFERELESWLSDMEADPANRAVVREMMEAGMETDASGLHVRRQGGKLYFEQRMLYIRAVKR